MAYHPGPAILPAHGRNLMYWKETPVLSPPRVLLQHSEQPPEFRGLINAGEVTEGSATGQWWKGISNGVPAPGQSHALSPVAVFSSDPAPE